MIPPLYVTGTNTNVGKTFLSTLLLRRARERGIKMAALKPFCSGGRDDAIQLHSLQTAGLTLDQVNAFHFVDPVTPLVAARKVGRKIDLAEVVDQLQNVLALNFPTLIEGAGGLLSPLGENFTLRDLIQKVPGPTVLVAPNILGTINSLLLTIEALGVMKPAVVLMSPKRPDASTQTNAAITREFAGVEVFELPFLQSPPSPPIARVLDQLIDRFFRLDAKPTS
jgi:dethiobiotin synthetase